MAVFDRRREQGRFKGSNEGAGGSSEGARASTKVAGGSIEGALWGSAGV